MNTFTDQEIVARSLWAKSGWDEDGAPHWLPLLEHLTDSGDVAAYLWERWIARSVRQRVADELGSDGHAKVLLTFLASIHDIGKATPAFALAPSAHRALAERIRAAGLQLPMAVPDRSKLHHSIAGQVIVSRWLDARGADRRKADTLAVVVGGHHGVPPGMQPLLVASSYSHLLGNSEWRTVQEAILDRMLYEAGAAEVLNIAVETGLSQPVQVLLSGAVILADWLASNVDYFPLIPLATSVAARPDRSVDGRKRIAFPMAWDLPPAPPDLDEHLVERFGLPPGSQARPIQQAAIRAVKDLAGSGIVIIDAPMGEGKTEAALIAAEHLARVSGASGIYFALPTQATANAVFARVLAWLQRMPSGGGTLDAGIHPIALLHGRAGLTQAWRELPVMRGVSGVGQDEDVSAGEFVRTYVDPWIRGRKRAILADFAVGTVDQLLFTALRSRHLALRHLGVASKVVVVDEVHSYDAYMDVYLCRTLEWLGAYRVPVILLSATLAEHLRGKLLSSYLSGLAQGSPSPGSFALPAAQFSLGAPGEGTPYPAITTSEGTTIKCCAVPSPARKAVVVFRRLDDNLDALAIVLKAALADGGCALVVRNTVARAIEAAEFLRGELPFEVRLLHSRFTADDRLAKEAKLITDFGPGRGNRAADPSVVIGTQVVEQSLDIDFDVIVTDIAPIDLILQRIGRLHRHQETLPGYARCPSVRSPVAWVTGVADWDAVPPTPVKGSLSVYGLHPLLRSLAVLGIAEQDMVRAQLPDAIRAMVERAYGDEPIGPDEWQAEMARARAEEQARLAASEERARAFRVDAPASRIRSLGGWLDGAAEADEDSAIGQCQVRDGEASVEVLLFRRSDLSEVVLSPGQEGLTSEMASFQWGAAPSDEQARKMLGCAVRLPAWAVEGPRGDRLIAELETRWWPEAWQQSPLLRGKLVLLLEPDGSQICGGLRFLYSSERGLEVFRGQ